MRISAVMAVPSPEMILDAVMVLEAIRKTYVKTSDESLRLVLYLTLLKLGLKPLEAIDLLYDAVGY